jgi:uncharacterized membrane protein
MFEKFSYWLFLFFLFNTIGWVLESTIESLYHKRLINRGFLTGPYIQIYGVGGVMLAIIGIYVRPYTPFAVFFAGVIAATGLEYLIGGILERVFKKQFWDYSMLKFTYKNRISLLSSLFWGVLSLFMTYILYGFISPPVLSINPYIIYGINAVMTVIMGADALVQIDKQKHIEEMLAKLPYERARETLLKTIMRIGTPRQIHDALLNKLKFLTEDLKRFGVQYIDITDTITEDLPDDESETPES